MTLESASLGIGVGSAEATARRVAITASIGEDSFMVIVVGVEGRKK